MADLKLTPAQIARAADVLGVDYCTIAAITQVESPKGPFLSDGRPVILFEGHWMWRLLDRKNIDPQPWHAKYPNIVYPSQDSSQYAKGKDAEDRGRKEYERLAIAESIDKECAWQSASWGAFQIMGFNYQVAGYKNITAFVIDMKAGTSGQVQAFINFIKGKHYDRFLKNKDWASFAEGYNGPKYKDDYAAKIAKAYNSCVVLTNSQPQTPSQEKKGA